MDQNWVNIVKRHDEIGWHAWHVPNRQHPKSFGGGFRGLFCDPTVGALKIWLVGYFISMRAEPLRKNPPARKSLARGSSAAPSTVAQGMPSQGAPERERWQAKLLEQWQNLEQWVTRQRKLQQRKRKRWQWDWSANPGAICGHHVHIGAPKHLKTAKIVKITTFW